MKTIQSKLRFFLISISVIGMATFFLVSVGYADSTYGPLSTEHYTDADVDAYEDIYNTRYDNDKYHSSKSSDGNTINYRTDWQALGNSAGIEDYGVKWSTSDDGGSTWSTYGNTEILYTDQKVKFQFNMFSANQGEHLANVLKSWIDWGVQDDSPSFDTVLYKNAMLVDAIPDSGSYSFEKSEIIDLSTVSEGTAYLRARVTCTESINTVNGDPYTLTWCDLWNLTYEERVAKELLAYQNAFDAFSSYNQGEIEDWKFTVMARPGSGDPVPEPATFALFGMGLIGLARWGRKKA